MGGRGQSGVSGLYVAEKGRYGPVDHSGESESSQSLNETSTLMPVIKNMSYG
jgi:hypothetical protein